MRTMHHTRARVFTLWMCTYYVQEGENPGAPGPESLSPLVNSQCGPCVLSSWNTQGSALMNRSTLANVVRLQTVCFARGQHSNPCFLVQENAQSLQLVSEDPRFSLQRQHPLILMQPPVTWGLVASHHGSPFLSSTCGGFCLHAQKPACSVTLCQKNTQLRQIRKSLVLQLFAIKNGKIFNTLL